MCLYLGLFRRRDVFIIRVVYKQGSVYIQVCLEAGKCLYLGLFRRREVFISRFVQKQGSVYIQVCLEVGKFLYLGLFRSWEVFISRFVQNEGSVYIQVCLEGGMCLYLGLFRRRDVFISRFVQKEGCVYQCIFSFQRRNNQVLLGASESIQRYRVRERKWPARETRVVYTPTHKQKRKNGTTRLSYKGEACWM